MKAEHLASRRVDGEQTARSTAGRHPAVTAVRMLAMPMAFLCMSIGSEAWAQYPCPGGAGPGERQVGMTQPGPGGAAVPLCQSDGPAPPPSGHNSYASIAFHDNAADIWVDGDYSGPGTSERVALEMCAKAMGKGCWSSGEYSNSTVAVFRNAAGRFYYAWLGDGGVTRKKVLAQCSAGQILPCELFTRVGSGTRSRAPKGDPRKSYAVAVWRSTADGNRKIYVASGHRTPEEADSLAKKACADDSGGRPCEVASWTGNGLIQAYHLDGKKHSFGVAAENSLARVQQAIREDCKQLASTICEPDGLFDSRKPGLFVHTMSDPKAP